jgi:hypothetical protein
VLLRGPASSRATVASTLWIDILATVAVGISTAMVVTLLPTIGRRQGLEPLGLAALACAPFVANILGIAAGRVGPRTTQQFGLLRVASALPLVCLPLFGIPQSVIIVAALFWIVQALTAPFQFRLWGSTYPPRLHDRAVGVFGMARAAAAAVAALLAGIAAETVGGPAAVAATGAVAALLALTFTLVRRWTGPPWLPYTAKQSLSALRSSLTIRRLAVAQALFGGGFIAATPLIVLVYVDRLDLSLADVGVLGVLGAVASSVSSIVWGIAAHRLGADAPVRIGSVIGALGLFLYGVAPTFIVACVAAIAVGVTLAAIEIGTFAIIARETDVEARAVTIGGWNAMMGMRGLVAPFLASSAVQVGLIDVTTGIFCCLGASVVGIIAFWRLPRTGS